jgi:uncharacterized protein
MLLSKYSKIYPSLEDNNSVILYSTKTAAAVLVPSSLVQDIEKNCLSDEEEQSLTDLGFLVHNHAQEKQDMQGFIRDLNFMNTSLNYVLVLNLDCNLACAYCFEGGRTGKFYLSDETAEQFVDFVKHKSRGKKELKITFYGGEPLLSMERIEGISKKLLLFAEEQGLAYGFSLVTNGTLLTPGNVKRLKPLGLKSAKVTLDGPERVHDRFRPFKSGHGSFDTIIRNVKDVCGMLRIQIGGNYTEEHYRAFPELLDELMNRGLGPDRIPLVKFDPVVNENSEFALPDFHDGCDSVNEPWISDAAIFLRKEILIRGYKTQKIMPSPCLLELEDSLVVNFDGALYKCPGLIGRESCSIGNLAAGVTDYHASHCLDSWKNDECLSCAYLPLCFGGCKYLKLLRDNNMHGINCQKEYFNRSLGELVRQDIGYNL